MSSESYRDEERMKRWMERYLNRGNFSDIEDAEEAFEEGLSESDGWVTEKVILLIFLIFIN